MAAPPENKESNSFSVTIDDWNNFLSPVYRVNGYPWRLRSQRRRDQDGSGLFSVFLICDKSSEAELWKCTATIKMTQSSKFDLDRIQHFDRTFTSWFDNGGDLSLYTVWSCFMPCTFKIDIATREDGNSWRLYPVKFSDTDCILVCGQNKIHVNKKSLASHSPFFDILFYGDYKEKDMEEIPIGDVEGEEFLNIIKLLYRFEGACLSDQNVVRVLQLADRFDLKFVEDKAVSYLLSHSTLLCFGEKCLIANQYNLFSLMEILIMRSAQKQLFYLTISISEEFEQMFIDSLNVGSIDAFPVIEEWKEGEEVTNDRESPALDPLEPRDGILVFEQSTKKIEVNKKSLASQSPYFNGLFFNNPLGKDIKEIHIEDVYYEEFANIMAILYGYDDNTTIYCGNVQRMLQLADKFKLKVVEERVVSFLLSSDSSDFSLLDKLQIANENNRPYLKDGLISECYSIDQLKELRQFGEWNQLSKETIRILFKRFCLCLIN